MSGVDDLRRESETIQREADALAKSADELDARLKARAQLAGDEIAAISQAETTALEARAADLRQRASALQERVDNFRFDSMPGPVGWAARRHWAWGFAAAIALGLLNAYAISRFDGVRLGFIEAAAQVLPVLFIAIALEGRLMADDALLRLPAVRSYYAALVGWMVIGEVAAFVGLACGRVSPLVVGLTGSALVCAGITLAVMFAITSVPES